MKVFGYEPAVIAYAVNAAVALLVAYGLDLSQGQVEAVAVITTGVLAAVAAVMTRPVVVSTITGAAATILTALAAFKIELTADQIGATVTGLSIVLALLLRQNVSPAPGVTARRP
ncbi:hypothetical protein [Actinomadura rubrisoli]|uniref:Uncharacterized protein n=1 Tax=Actinomadura rubrisoli TaxID=2530368 RepID=A0A4R5CF73_9ACTN|nr:hypothetical protein [Actinomadura rubrisoli]TDD97659.1 hypothetical protein E1298_01090 [Actinomadura rubrisoli]